MAQVLLIDDDQLIVDLLESLLTMKGHRSTKTTDGEAGLNLAQEQKFDLIITDLNLPKITGWDIIKQLKSTEETRSIPIIALSAHTDADDRDAAHTAGCDAYVAKPLDPASLLATVDSILKV